MTRLQAGFLGTTFLLLSCGLAWAEEEVPAGPPGPNAGTEEDKAVEPAAPPVLREVENKEAKALAKALKKAAKKKSSGEVLPALEAIKELKHDDFIKPLTKLMLHENARVAQWATEYLEWRADKRDIKGMWKNAWGNKVNKRRYAVHAGVLRAMAHIEQDLDDKQLKDVRRDWEWMNAQPHASFAQPLADYATYFGKRKDKRFCIKLALELDQPSPANVHAENNPPADWWEKRVKMWQGMHGEVVKALKEITGQEFANREAAKKWFTENEKSFDVKWREW